MNIPYQIKHWWCSLKCFFNSRQKWLIKRIPKTWIDKDSLIEICIFESIRHYVEGEDCFNVLSTDETCGNKEQLKFLKEVKTNYDYITKILPILNKKLDDAWKRIPIITLNDIMLIENKGGNSKEKDLLPQKKKWKDYGVSHKQVATAIFNYFESKGYEVNRKRGIQYIGLRGVPFILLR